MDLGTHMLRMAHNKPTGWYKRRPLNGVVGNLHRFFGPEPA